MPSRVSTPAAAAALTVAVGAVVSWLRFRKARRERAAAAQRVLGACEALSAGAPDDATTLDEVLDDVVAHLAVEGAVFIAGVPRDPATRAIDYGALDKADPRWKLSDTGWRAAPAALLPAPMSASFYRAAIEVAGGAIGRLVDAVATDYAWLRETFGALAETDDWTRRMLELAHLDDAGRRLRCHVARADFMQNADDASIVTIEVNTFAASLAGPATAVSDAHRRAVLKHCCASDRDRAAAEAFVLPPNAPADGLGDALAAAVRAYEARFFSRWGGNHDDDDDARRRRPVVLFVTVAEEDNEADHRRLERRLADAHGLDSLRRTVAQLAAELVVGGKSGDDDLDAPLVVSGREVGVAYFRLAAWARRGEAGWAVRRAIARARCVEVPSAAAHLAGLKRAQAAWSTREGLARLRRRLSRTDEDAILRVAAPQFALDDVDDARRARTFLARDDATPVVAKAARDGLGGLAHVFDRDAVRDLAVAACGGGGDDAERTRLARGVVVQAVARPRPRPSLVVADAAAPTDDSGRLHASRPSIPELGIFVTALRGAGPHRDFLRPVGHLVRSKHHRTQDGGICRGNAVVDSPILVPDPEDAGAS